MNTTARTYTIRELAEEFELTLRALRFYEQRGLLAPLRSGLDRVYTEQDRQRVAEVQRMRKLGFTVREIKRGHFPREMFAVQLSLAKKQRAELDQVIAELEQKAAA